VTTNPTIFQKAISGSDVYAAQLHDLAALTVPVEEAVDFMIAHDVRAVCDLLRPVYHRTDGLDGRVSIEVDPLLAVDTDRTVAEARLLWWLVDRPNLMIKIPATAEGLPAITACLAEGISVNVTLIFSRQRYAAWWTPISPGWSRPRTRTPARSSTPWAWSAWTTTWSRRWNATGSTRSRPHGESYSIRCPKPWQSGGDEPDKPEPETQPGRRNLHRRRAGRGVTTIRTR
jgi:hypothetical protein